MRTWGGSISLEVRCILHKGITNSSCLDSHFWSETVQHLWANHTCATSQHIDHVAGKLGQTVAFLKTRRDVELWYGLVADRKQQRNGYFSNRRLKTWWSKSYGNINTIIPFLEDHGSLKCERFSTCLGVVSPQPCSNCDHLNVYKNFCADFVACYHSVYAEWSKWL